VTTRNAAGGFRDVSGHCSNRSTYIGLLAPPSEHSARLFSAPQGLQIRDIGPTVSMRTDRSTETRFGVVSAQPSQVRPISSRSANWLHRDSGKYVSRHVQAVRPPETFKECVERSRLHITSAFSALSLTAADHSRQESRASGRYSMAGNQVPRLTIQNSRGPGLGKPLRGIQSTDHQVSPPAKFNL
jgi:hypothetical protein